MHDASSARSVAEHVLNLVRRFRRLGLANFAPTLHLFERVLPRPRGAGGPLTPVEHANEFIIAATPSVNHEWAAALVFQGAIESGRATVWDIDDAYRTSGCRVGGHGIYHDHAFCARLPAAEAPAPAPGERNASPP